MVTPPDIEALILRYYHVEKWKIGTIAAQLHIHHNVVQRVLAQAGLPRIGSPRPSMIDPYLPFISQTLEKFPKLTASRLYAMVRERGYPGRPDHFRHLIGCHRPRPKAEAFLRLRTLPGEQAQVDWALCRARHSAHYAEIRTMPSYWAPCCSVHGLFGIRCRALGIVLFRLRVP
jgi:transposase